MKKSNLLVALLAFAGMAQAGPYSAWNKYRDIVINTTSTGANVAGTVTNFPVLVRLTNANDAAGANVLSEALSGGADIRFTDSTGNTALGYEIESWSATSAAIWVKVPSIVGNSNTKIRLYWNRTGATSSSSGASVFGSNNFLGVWHLGNAAAGAARPNSASPGTNDATPGGTEAATIAPKAGLIGMSDSLRSQNAGQESDDHFSMGPMTFPDSQVTVSMWVLLPDPQLFNAWNHFFSHGNTNLEDNLWFGRNNNTTTLRARSAHGGAESGNTPSTDVPGALATLNTWKHFAVSKDSLGGRRWRIYVDGVRSVDFYNSADNHKFVAGLRENNYIGRSLWPDRNSHIKVDEMRTSSIARSADWMKLEFETQKPAAAAITLGAAVTQATPALAYTVKNVTYMLNQAITTNTPVSSGTPTGYSVAPALPAGLTLNTTSGTITGTPTAVSASTSYVVSATLNSATVRDTLMIAVTAGTPPGAPTAVTGVRGNGQVVLSWSAPASAGTSAITAYKAMAMPDTAKSCTTTGALTCTITGLTNGTAYTFVVLATNGTGRGPASTASAPITPATVPGAPTNVTITMLSGAGTTATATMNWTAPASDGGSPITNYFASSTPAGAACAATPPATTCTVTGLAYGTTYSVSVYGINAIGSGALSTGASITPTGILPGSLLIRVSGSSRPFTFVLPQEALQSTERVTMSIADVWGRTVWSSSINPKANQVKEISWNGRASNGTQVSAGMYVVKIATTTAGITTEFTEKAVTLK